MCVCVSMCEWKKRGSNEGLPQVVPHFSNWIHVTCVHSDQLWVMQSSLSSHMSNNFNELIWQNKDKYVCRRSRHCGRMFAWNVWMDW